MILEYAFLASFRNFKQLLEEHMENQNLLTLWKSSENEGLNRKGFATYW